MRSAEHAMDIEDRDLEMAAFHQYELEQQERESAALTRPASNPGARLDPQSHRKPHMNANTLDSLSFDKLVPSESKYLKKEDFDESGTICTIKGFQYESIKTDDGDEDKTVMYLEEFDKGLVLNRTNASLIPICTGAKTAGEARGKQIVIYVDPTVGFGGKIVGGLRLKRVPGAPKAAPRAAKQPPVDFQDDETVPF